MSMIKNLLSKKDNKIQSYDDFWAWFQTQQKSFHKVVKNSGNIEKDFFNKLSPKFDELKEGYFFLTGLADENTVKLVFTADGAIRNFVFVDELVQAAPSIEGWKFTAHKPSLDVEDVAINMEGFQFKQDNLSFYPNENPAYPDEIDITVVHADFAERHRSAIINGVYIFLDNYLGELNFATMVDYLKVDAKPLNPPELIPIKKLKDYLIWRQKEFIEKYEGIRHDTENDNYGSFEGELENGNPLLAIMNTDLLQWDSKASHPWILKIDIKYDTSSNSGLPDDDTYALMDAMENEMNNELRDSEGYLNIGRQTADGLREIYYGCKDFRKSSRVAFNICQKYKGTLDIDYDVFKDKYWRVLNQFMT
ncbi:MAG: DUF695 domain-containing protein [Bacteroidota bacterium]